MVGINNRSTLLDAALTIAQRDGVGAVTLDAVAAEAGMSKGGLIYHFRSKDALISALIAHITQLWEEKLLAALGAPFEHTSRSDRVRAYIEVTSDPVNGPTSADLAVIVDSIHSPHLLASWEELMGRWADPAELTTRQRTAMLAADGLWMAHASGDYLHTTPRDLRAIIDVMLALAEDPG